MNDERLRRFRQHRKQAYKAEEKRLQEELGDLRAARMQNWHIRNQGIANFGCWTMIGIVFYIVIELLF